MLANSVRRAALINPHGVATLSGGYKQNWLEFSQRVAQLASGLCSLGVEPGDRVAILAANSSRYLEVMYAVFWAGGMLVPINTRLNVDATRRILDDCAPKALFIDESLLSNSTDLATRFSTIVGSRGHDELIARSAPIEDSCPSSDAPAAIVYTGGTTGNPKGAVLTHGNLAVNTMNCLHEMGFRFDSRFLHTPPLFHVGAISAACALTMHAGTHVVLDGFDPEEYASAIQDIRITDLFVVPTMLTMLLGSGALGNRDMSSVRSVMYGGSPISSALLECALRAFPQAEFRQFYGMTELSASGTVLRPEHHREPSKLASAGQPMFSVELKIVDTESGVIKAVGEVGEIVARGPGVMQGYWHRPDLTADVLRNGWLHTGDVGYLDADGFLFVVDRLKDMIVTGGENVYSAEVDRVLAAHPAVLECATIGVPHPKWGEAVHSVVVLKDGQIATESELTIYCKARLGGYQCPRSITFRRERLPANKAGKILKKLLREEYQLSQEPDRRN